MDEAAVWMALRKHLATDPIGPILDRRIPLDLTPSQISRLEGVQTAFRADADSALAPLARLVMREGRRATDIGLIGPLNAAVSQLALVITQAHTEGLGILSEEQRWQVGH